MRRIPSPSTPLARRLTGLSWRQTAVITFGAGLAAAAGAQTPPPTPPVPQDGVVLAPVKATRDRTDDYTVPTTTGATKLTLTPRETPQSITVITRERLADQNLTSLRDVLDNTPGIFSNAYDTERVLFYSRGFLVDTLLYDGVPAMPSFTTSSVNETLDTALYERIEIIRGANGLMAGAGNPAAAINLVRKRANSKVPAITADFTFSSWNTKRAEIDASVPLNAAGTVRARGVLAVEDGDSYQNLYRKRSYTLYGVIDADLTDTTRLSVGIDQQDNRPQSVTWGSFPLLLSNGELANWPRSVTTATDWTFWNRRTQNAFVNLQQEFGNGWKLQSTLSHRRFEEDVSLFYVDGFPDPVTGAGLTPYAYRSKAKVNETALDVHATKPFELLGRKHELVVGYNGSRAKNTGTEQASGAIAPIDNFFQWTGSHPQPSYDPSIPLNDIRTDQDAVYAATRISLAAPLKLIAGGRYGRWDVDSFYIYETPNNAKYSFKKFIPYAGLVWDVLPQYSAFVSYTGIFKPQNSRGSDGRYLDPIDGRSIELGIKGEHFDKLLNTSFVVFDTRQSNVAAPVLDGSGNPVLLPDNTAVSQGIDGTRTRGFELEATGRLARGWKGSLGWTRHLTKDANDQQIRTFIPSTLVRAFTTWEPEALAGKLSLGAGVNWQSASSTTIGAPGNTPYQLNQRSVTNVSLMARYAFTPSLSLQFNGNNVLDKTYYVLDQYSNTYYGAPANYALSLRLKY